MIFIISDSMLGREWSGVKFYRCRVSKTQNMGCVCGRVATGKQGKQNKKKKMVLGLKARVTLGLRLVQKEKKEKK